MVGVSHVVFIDESGNSQPGSSIQSLWATVAIAIPFERVRDLEVPVHELRTRNFRSRVKEIKGSLVPHELLANRTVDDLYRESANILSQYGAHVWATLSRFGCVPPPGFSVPNASTKQIVRQLLLERVNGFLNLGNYRPFSWLMVWDVSDVQELTDFSDSVAKFTNAFSGEPLNERLFPLILGGLSHDWAGLQLADLVSNGALHRFGHELHLPDASPSKAAAFDSHLFSTLQKTRAGAIVGWKVW